jgi:hypothetical protein
MERWWERQSAWLTELNKTQNTKHKLQSNTLDIEGWSLILPWNLDFVI